MHKDVVTTALRLDEANFADRFAKIRGRRELARPLVRD
jgi:hypothetical protein